MELHVIVKVPCDGQAHAVELNDVADVGNRCPPRFRTALRHFEALLGGIERPVTEVRRQMDADEDHEEKGGRQPDVSMDIVEKHEAWRKCAFFLHVPNEQHAGEKATEHEERVDTEHGVDDQLEEDVASPREQIDDVARVGDAEHHGVTDDHPAEGQDTHAVDEGERVIGLPLFHREYPTEAFQRGELHEKGGHTVDLNE